MAGLIESIGERLLGLLNPVLAPIRSIVELLLNFKQKTLSLIGDIEHLVTSAVNEYEQIKNFKSRPEWKNRVISVPRVIDNVTQLAAIPTEVLNAIKDLVANVKARLSGGTSDLEDADLQAIEDTRGFVTKLAPKLARIGEKILGIATIVLDAIGSIESTVKDLQTIVDDISKVRSDLENLDGLFLPQNNKRKTLTTSDGETFQIRVGSLHS